MLSRAEKAAIENYLHWRPETVIAKRLWDAGYREADFIEKKMRAWTRTLPDPHVLALRNHLREWARQESSGESLQAVHGGAGSGFYEPIDALPFTAPVVRPKSRSTRAIAQR